MTPSSALLEQRVRHVSCGVLTASLVVAVRAAGVEHWDVDGKRKELARGRANSLRNQICWIFVFARI